MAHFPGISSDSGFELDVSDLSDYEVGVVDRHSGHQVVRTPGFAVQSLLQTENLEVEGDDSEEVSMSPFTALNQGADGVVM